MRNTLITIATLIALILTFTAFAEESFSGVGLVIMPKGQEIMIDTIIPNSPAEKAGITPGLVIMKVDDKTTEGMQVGDCGHMIRGPVGSKVKLELLDPVHNKTITYEVIRGIIRLHRIT